VRSDATGAPARVYVRSLTVDGKARTAPWLHAAQLLRGARLRYTMSDRPTRWGSAVRSAPPSGAGATPRSCR
jgi:putative alpha-1,2-mannosidase